MTRVLLTAFEPFGGETVNPSAQAAQLVVDGPAVPGAELTLVVLPVVFGAADELLLAALAEHDPELVVCLGQAGGRTGITPERFAHNLDHCPEGDNAGARPLDAPIVDGGPAAYVSTLPVRGIVTALQDAGIPSAPSSTAGHHLCNHVSYRLAHHLAGRPDVRGGFVHLPYSAEQVASRPGPPPSLPLATLADAVRTVVRVCVAGADPLVPRVATG